MWTTSLFSIIQLNPLTKFRFGISKRNTVELPPLPSYSLLFVIARCFLVSDHALVGNNRPQGR